MRRLPQRSQRLSSQDGWFTRQRRCLQARRQMLTQTCTGGRQPDERCDAGWRVSKTVRGTERAPLAAGGARTPAPCRDALLLLGLGVRGEGAYRFSCRVWFGDAAYACCHRAVAGRNLHAPAGSAGLRTHAETVLAPGAESVCRGKVSASTPWDGQKWVDALDAVVCRRGRAGRGCIAARAVRRR